MSNPNPYHPDAQGAHKRQTREDFLKQRYSPEELRVFAECESEAFRYRSLPLSIGLGTATLLAVKNGVLKAHPKFGPWPKVVTMSLFGYIAGRLSYSKKCQEKIMALPNSRIAEMLRRNQHRRGNNSSNWEMGLGIPQEAATGLSLDISFKSTVDSDEFSQPNALNLDTSRPQYSSLDDVYTPTMEGNNDLNEDLVIPQHKNAVTYDELRRKNRDDYAKNHYGSNNPNQWAGAAATPPQPHHSNPTPRPFVSQPPWDNDRRRANLRSRMDDDSDGGQKTGPKNRYGDTWSE